MAKDSKHTPDQIVILLGQIEAPVANGKTPPAVCRKNGITEQIGCGRSTLTNSGLTTS
jgi:hypothetical protein